MTQKIIIAQGVEIRDKSWAVALLEYLNANAHGGKGSVWTYPKAAGARAKYEVKVVHTKAAFATALDSPGAYVVYDGHSRYGQGPAFGPAGVPDVPDKKNYPENPWGDHFRMGYEATDTECRGDLLRHSVMPVEYDLTTASDKDFLPRSLREAAPEARRLAKKTEAGGLDRKRLCSVEGAWRSLDECHPELAGRTTKRGDKPLQGRHYYLDKPELNDYLTAVRVGSADLERSSLRCSVLFMSSCSSRVHYRRPLHRRRRVLNSKCKFYLTAKLCSGLSAVWFVQAVFEGVDPTEEPRENSNRMCARLNEDTHAGMVTVW